MHTSTCLLVFNDVESLQHSQQLLRENFPNSAIQILRSHEQLLNSVHSIPTNGEFESPSCVVLTDQPPTVDFVSQSGKYLPVVFVEQDTTEPRFEKVPSQRPTNYQMVDFSENEKVIEAVKHAIGAAEQFLKLKSRTSKLNTLAERERQIIQLASDGVPNKTIAVRLGISIKTVEKNRRNAYTKLSVSSTAEMASVVTFGRLFGAFG